MPRKPNTRQTNIYWLIDMRPATLVKWPSGLPFYCGKTVSPIHVRLFGHFKDSLRYPKRRVSTALRELGNNVKILSVEIVPPNGDWVTRERHWITLLRNAFPNTANVSDGGQGMLGYVPTAETRRKTSVANKGKKRSEAVRLSNAKRQRGKSLSPAARLKLHLFHIGKPKSAEHKAKMRAGWATRRARLRA